MERFSEIDNFPCYCDDSGPSLASWQHQSWLGTDTGQFDFLGLQWSCSISRGLCKFESHWCVTSPDAEDFVLSGIVTLNLGTGSSVRYRFLCLRGPRSLAVIDDSPCMGWNFCAVQKESSSLRGAISMQVRSAIIDSGSRVQVGRGFHAGERTSKFEKILLKENKCTWDQFLESNSSICSFCVCVCVCVCVGGSRHPANFTSFPCKCWNVYQANWLHVISWTCKCKFQAFLEYLVPGHHAPWIRQPNRVLSVVDSDRLFLLSFIPMPIFWHRRKLFLRWKKFCVWKALVEGMTVTDRRVEWKSWNECCLRVCVIVSLWYCKDGRRGNWLSSA